MIILLVEDQSEEGKQVASVIEKKFGSTASLEAISDLPKAIEQLEHPKHVFDLVLCDYHGTSNVLLSAFLSLVGKNPTVLFLDDDATIQAMSQQFAHQPSVQFVSRKNLKASLLATLENFIQKGWIQAHDHAKVAEEQNKKLEELANKPNASPEQLRQSTQNALESLHSLVDNLGFSPEAQKLAKNSATATLRLIGSRPRLADILGQMKKQQGKYIVSHSLMLAQVSCALAHRIGWTSSATYLKLSLASFLHDLPLKNNLLAECASLSEAENGGFTPEELKAFKNHPIAAADYASKFDDIPADVDTILAQHHERPDGSGFPRGLAGNRLAPLSSLFIMAQDLFHHTLKHGPDAAETYFTTHSEQYSTGQFKKILRALQNNSEADPL